MLIFAADLAVGPHPVALRVTAVVVFSLLLLLLLWRRGRR
jgi:hypothetical protein